MKSLTYKSFFFFLMLLSTMILAQNTYVLDVSGAKRLFYVVDNASDDLDFSANYTIEFWIKIASDEAINYRKIFVRGDIDDDATDYWTIGNTAGSTSGYKINLKNHDAAAATTGYIGVDNISFDEWHFISFTCDGSRMYTHLDGVRQNNYAATKFALATANDTLTFFGKNDASSVFDSKIDDIRISNIARYTSADYTKPSAPLSDDANTILLYHFDDNTELPPLSSASNYSFTHTNGAPRTPSSYGIITGNYVSDSSLPLPVELMSFTINVSGNEVLLNWQTATEVNNYGFEVQRQAVSNENSEWETIGFVEGAGNSNSPKSYSFTDNVSASGKYSYRLKQIDLDGTFEYSDVVEVNIGTPVKFELSQNYPNPFNPSTTISYSIPSVIARSEATKQSVVNVTLAVYNALGQKVATLVNKAQAAGNYTVQFDARDLPSGVYFYTLHAGDFVATKKMILMK